MSTQRRQLTAQRVDPERVAVQDVRLEHRGEQVVRGADRVDVAGEVEVQVLHRHDLRVAAARRAALDPEHRAERRLAQAEHRPLADVPEALGQRDRRRRLPLARLRRRDRRDADELRRPACRRGGRGRRGRPSPCSCRRARPLPGSSPSSAAISAIGRSFAAWAISRLDCIAPIISGRHALHFRTGDRLWDRTAMRLPRVNSTPAKVSTVLRR